MVREMVSKRLFLVRHSGALVRVDDFFSRDSNHHEELKIIMADGIYGTSFIMEGMRWNVSWPLVISGGVHLVEE